MKLNRSYKILIVGLGLIGGSYALALKKKGYYVTAITKEQDSIDYATAHDMIDAGSATPDAALIGEADLVVFALYPHVFLEWIAQYQGLLKSGAILTDVTGVKSCIVYEIQQMLREDVEFISAHPMAGREVSGVQNSDDSIFKGANYIVVPTEKNTEQAIAVCRSLGHTLGFKDISQLSPEKHDEMIAFLSQLTHCIAVSLMCANDNPDLEYYTGDSFRDLTRIARINDEMWSELFLANREALLLEMDRFRTAFDRMYNCVKTGNREDMRAMMRCSTARRKRFDKMITEEIL